MVAGIHKGICVLVADLESPDRDTRFDALKALEKLDPMMVSAHAGAIMRTLCDRYYQSRISLQARHVLRGLLCARNSDVRLAAANAIVEMLDFPDRRVRAEAVHTMVYMDPALAAVHAGAIVRALGDRSDSGIHPAAHGILVSLGRDSRVEVRLAAAKPVAEMLCDSNSNVREGAMQTLLHMDPLVCAFHAGAIVRMSDPSCNTTSTKDAAARALDKLLLDSSEEVHLQTAKSIGDILGDSSWIVRMAAVRTLGKLELVGCLAPFVGAIVRMLDDPVGRVYTEAVCALQRQPPASLSLYVDDVARKLCDSHVDVRFDAVTTLGRMETAVLVRRADVIVRILGDVDFLVREAALNVLRGLKPVEVLSPHVDVIVKLLDDTVSIRVAACDVLGRLDPAARAPHAVAIARRIADPSAVVRIGVMRMLHALDPVAFAPHASAVAEMIVKPVYIDERHAALDAMNAFVRKLSEMLCATESSSHEDALCALVAAGAGGDHAVSADADFARLVERARLIQSGALSFVK